jgi:phosphopantothenoylcysteine decarboxylase/phosphopantothenate--cysteine ligase
VILISAPTSLETPVGTTRLDVRTAAEMRDKVLQATREANVLLMAAAVADFRPKKAMDEKIKRSKGMPHIELEPTEDILSQVAAEKAKSGKPQIIVGFAAESEDLVANARMKLEQKGLTLIVANDISAKNAGFGVDTNQVTLLDAKGGIQELPLMSKAEVAEVVLQRVVNLFGTPE